MLKEQTDPLNNIMDINAEKYISKCIKYYPHLTNIVWKKEYLTLPTNKYIELPGVCEWLVNSVTQPISISTRPGACIKYMVFSVINCLSGRMLDADYQMVDPYLAINRKAYQQMHSEWHDKLFPTDGQVKLGIILLEKFSQLKINNGLSTFLYEEFFNYLTPYQLLFLQGVLSSLSVTGCAMWYVNNTTSSLFNIPNDQDYKIITPTQTNYAPNKLRFTGNNQYYISMSICTLFNHINRDIKLTIYQLFDAINLLDMPTDITERIDRYLQILTTEQSSIVYL